MSRRRRSRGGVGEAARRTHSWLELLTTSGPFLTLPVVHRVFPDGLPAVPIEQRARVRSAVAAMIDDCGASRHQVVAQVLRGLLGWDDRLLLDDQVPAALAEPVVEHGFTLRPTLAFVAPDDEGDPPPDGHEADVEAADDESDDGEAALEPASPYRMLGLVTPWGQHPLARVTEGGWTASAVERLAVLLRARDVPVGLATDGRWWAVIWAPRGGTTGAAVWDAGLFSEEPDSLRAFVALLKRSRFLAVAPSDTLPALLTESLGAQEEVTVALGAQARDAVELLVRTLDRLDAESDDELLADVDDDQLYAGVVTMLMRIVFLLFAEDRRLLPSDDDLYLGAYSIGALVDRLEQEARLAGEQALEHRTAAWHRLLATSRALHGGVAHEDLRLPAYGGSLFDPEAHPWLETADRVDDRTVLRLLRAVQYVEIDRERRRLSFRALDVEQIGYVYEGLLELEVRTADELVFGFARSKKQMRPWPKEVAEFPLSQVRGWLAEVPPPLVERLTKPTGRSDSALEKQLARLLEDHERSAIRTALGADQTHVETAVRLATVLHWYDDGSPALTPRGRRYLAGSTRRASTGTHYTPRDLAEDVVKGALEPLVFRPGPIETADATQWQRRPSTAIESLRVADIAMGSGAFLVAACRYLANHLVRAWEAEGREDAMRLAAARQGRVHAADAEVDEVELAARRTVAERCLYGVDINPLAVEMAKLSLWLVTMDTERPFGFLDDRLVAGDSLLGVVDVAQLETLHMDPVAGRRLHREELSFGEDWLAQLGRAADVRRQITAAPAVTVRDVEHKVRLLRQADAATEHVAAVADRLTGVGLSAAPLRSKAADTVFVSLQIEIGLDAVPSSHLRKAAANELQSGVPEGKELRRPLHWPVTFPEVLVDPVQPGFDAIVGNPPFWGGQKLSGGLGEDYLAWVQRWDGRGVKGSAELASRFVLRAQRLLNGRGQLGFITTNTLVQGATLRVGLEQAAATGLPVRSGRSSRPWPSTSANLEIVTFWASRAPLSPHSQRQLDDEDVPSLGPDLEPVGRVAGRPQRLRENENTSFQGSNVLGLGFTMSQEHAHELIARDSRNAGALLPYVIGKNLNQRPDQSASRWIINFRDWPLERAQQYPDLIEIVRRLVKPERDKKKREAYRNYWWRYGERRPGLYAAIADLDHVLALSRVGNAIVPVRVPTGPVYSEATVVFALDGFANLAVLSSSVHTVWVVRYTSTMRTDIRYAPFDVFLTLPRPRTRPTLAALGERLDTRRRELMLSRSWGLTTTYNAVHNPAVRDAEVVELRDIHEAIDHAVLDAYGWDLDPQVGHHPTKIGTRWTVSRDARFELLDLLLEENHRRHGVERR